MGEWHNPASFAIWLTIVLIVVIALSVSFVLLTRLYIKRILWEQTQLDNTKIEYQKRLVRDSVSIQEVERERIASDLHDELISNLNILRMVLYNCKIQSDMNPIKMLEDGISLSRRISHDLMPPMLEETEFVDLLYGFVYPLKDSFNLSFNTVGVKFDVIIKDNKLQLFRICQEVISNLIKHSKATIISVDLRFFKKSLFIRISDNGIGFNPSITNVGLGLKNIELRNQYIGGLYKFKSTANRGTDFLLLYNV